MTQKAIDLQQQLYEQVEQDVADRMTTHRHDLARARSLQFEGAPRQRNLVTVGDSWFDYPLGGPVGAGLHSDLGEALAESMHAVVLRLAHAGAATTGMFGVRARAHLEAALRDPAHGPFDAILFSGGGNDLCGEQFRLWLNAAPADKNPVHAINHAAVDAILTVVETGVRDLIALRDHVAPGTPILLNAYDWAWASAKPVCRWVGPWLRPSLIDRGWMTATAGDDVGHQIVKSMLEAFDKRLMTLHNPRAHVFKVQTQGTLTTQAQWSNELHPTPSGFRDVATKFAAVIDTLPEPALMAAGALA